MRPYPLISHCVAIVTSCALALLFSLPSHAIGPVFGDNGVALPPIYILGAGSTPSSVLHQLDGSVIVTGHASGPIGEALFAARFKSDGSLDPGYGHGGVVLVTPPAGTTTFSGGAGVMDAAGNVVMIGTVSASSNYGRLVVVRLKPDGTPDPTFGTRGMLLPSVDGATSGTYPGAIAIDSLQRIVIAGNMYDSSHNGYFAIRMTASGAPDTTFNGTGVRVVPPLVSTGSVKALALTSSDDVLFATSDGNISGLIVVKLTATGSMDLGFGNTGRAPLPSVGPMVVDSAGHILGVGGDYKTPQVVRLTPAGAPDNTFGLAGAITIGTLNGLTNGGMIRDLRLDSQGRILIEVTGSTANGPFVVVTRLTAEGALDPAFAVGGMLAFPVASDSAGMLDIDAADGLFAAGARYGGMYVAHVSSWGQLDIGFGDSGVKVQSVGLRGIYFTAMQQQSDGTLVLLGMLGGTSSAESLVVARLDTTGALDPTFAGLGYRVVSLTGNRFPKPLLAVDHAGRLVIAGRGDATVPKFIVMRLLPDGTTDTSFNATGIATFDEPVPAGYLGGIGVAIDTKDRIIYATSRLTRVLSTGALDTSFGTNGHAPLPLVQPSERVSLVADDADRVLVAGTLAANPTRTFAAMRLDANGALDAGFGTGGIAYASMPGDVSNSGSISLIGLDSAGRVTVAGHNSPVSASAPSASLARFTSAGALDNSFAITPSPASSGWWLGPVSIALDDAGRITLTGVTSYSSAANTVRLLVDGTIDLSFNQGLRLSTFLPWPVATPLATSAVVVNSNGTYVAGGFSSYGTGGMVVVKLFGGTPTRAVVVPAVPDAVPRAGTPFDFAIQAQDDAGNPQPVTTATTVVLKLIQGGGSIFGATSCNIPAGQTGCIVSGVTYSKIEYAKFAAEVQSGDPLATANSNSSFLYFQPTYVPVTITSHTPDPSTPLAPVTVTATVAFPATPLSTSGTIQVSASGGGACAMVLPATSSTLSISSLGTQTLQAYLTGNGAFGGTATAVTHSVVAATQFSGPVPAGTGNATVTFTGGGASCTLTDARFTSPPGSPPSGNAFPYGAFLISMIGCTLDSVVTFTMTYPGGLPALPTLRLYGSYATPAWQTLPFTSASANSITFSLVVGSSLTSPSYARTSINAYVAITAPAISTQIPPPYFWHNPQTPEDRIWRFGANGSVLDDHSLPPMPGAYAWLGGLADVNGDGVVDVIWVGSNHQVWLWRMTAFGEIAQQSQITDLGGSGWTLAGGSDLNGDARADLVWWNTETGALAVWYMAADGTIASARFFGVPLEWELSGVGDTNRDGIADFLWFRPSDGVVAIWRMKLDGTFDATFPGGVGPATGWRPYKVVDLDGDGFGDIWWRNTSGVNAVWYLNASLLDDYDFFVATPLDSWVLGLTWNLPVDQGRGRVVWYSTQDATVAEWRMRGRHITPLVNFMPSPGAPGWVMLPTMGPGWD